MPGGGLSDTTTSQGNDLQAEEGSRPVENPGNQVDTKDNKTAQGNKGQPSKKSQKDSIVNVDKQVKKGTQILGYVPIQIANLSLEEVKLQKQICVGKPDP